MRVARGHRVADAKELEFPGGVARHGLRLACNQLRIVHRALVGGVGFELKVKVFQRQRAVVDDHLVHHALFAHAAVVASQHGQQLAALRGVGCHRLQAEGDGKGHVQLLQAAHIGHQVHGHHLGRKRAVGGDDL